MTRYNEKTERTVTQLAESGKETKEIAFELGLSYSTVASIVGKHRKLESDKLVVVTKNPEMKFKQLLEKCVHKKVAAERMGFKADARKKWNHGDQVEFLDYDGVVKRGVISIALGDIKMSKSYRIFLNGSQEQPIQVNKHMIREVTA